MQRSASSESLLSGHMEKSPSSTEPLLSEHLQKTLSSEARVSGHKPLVYRSRWYVLAIVALSNILTNALWSSWGPISQSVKAVYKWDSGDLSFVINAGNVGSFLSIVVGCYLVDRKGIRTALLFTTLMLAVATATRVITMDPAIATPLIAIGQFVNGFASSVTSALPAATSDVWFPVGERNTATAVSAMAASLGSSVSFLLGPNIVSEPATVGNGTEINYNKTDVGLISRQIHLMNYIEFAWGGALFVLCLVYLPASPPTPPSVTAALARLDFKTGLLKLIRQRSVWQVALVYSVPLGTFGTWQSILDLILSPLGISQTEAGWLGFAGSVGGPIFGMVTSRFADRFRRRHRLLLIVNYAMVMILMAVFTCIHYKFLPPYKGLIYVTVVGSAVLMGGGVPLFLELACETSYPVAEGVTAGLLSMIITLLATVYLLLNMIPNIGTGWISWVFAGVLAASLPALMTFRAEYRRLDIDTAEREPGPGPEVEHHGGVVNPVTVVIKAQ